MREIYPNELYHYGVLGQKWRIRRYQNPDGSYTELGRQHYGIGEAREKNKDTDHEAAKQKAIRSGNVDEVRKFSSELTSDEMRVAIQRIRDEQTLDSLKASSVSKGQKAVNSLNKVLNNVKTTGESFKDIYNFVARVNNAFNSNKMPIIGNQDNDKAGNKPLSVEDRSKLFKLEQDKKKTAVEEKIDNLIQKKGIEYIRDNPDKFTADELQRALEYKKAAESEKWNRGNNSTESQGKKNESNKSKESDSNASKKQPSEEKSSQKDVSPKELPGGIDFVKDKKNSGEPDTSFKSIAISTAKTLSDFSTKDLNFTKDKKHSEVSTATKSGSDWVKENWDNDAPFSQFKTTSLSEHGVLAGFNGVDFVKDNGPSNAYRNAYNTYMREHPASEATFEDFVRWQSRK